MGTNANATAPPHQPKTLGEEDCSFIAKRYD